MNIANKLTLFRVFLVPIFIMSLLFLGINNINEYKLLFFVTILIILFIVVKTLYKDIISRILVSFLFSLMYNFILFLLIFIYLNEDENYEENKANIGNHSYNYSGSLLYNDSYTCIYGSG